MAGAQNKNAAQKGGIFEFSAARLRARGRTRCCRRGGDAALALGALAGELTSATDGFGLLPRLLFRGLLVIIAELHFAENAFALKLLLQGAQRLIHIVIANDYLQAPTALSTSIISVGVWLQGQ